ncbi:MAG: flagellar assembly peptidoglycan hydrolase FlgJ [Cellvibrionaceae bacterium]
MSIGSYSSNGSALPSASADMYTDLNSLQKIKQLGRGGDAEKQQALEAVAKQFESVFLNMMMKSMRDANEAFKDDSMSSSNEMDFYQNMFDQQLTLTLSKDGVGIADALVRQLQRQLPTSSTSVDQKSALSPFDFSSELKTLIPSISPNLKPGQVGDTSEGKNSDDTVSVDASAKESMAISSVAEFKDRLLPLAEKAARELGIDPKLILSQAALETGWGQHMIRKPNGESSFNLFGIKANHGWKGDVATVKTLEYNDGVAQPQRANFRSYASFEESFNDYVSFIKDQSRYQNALDGAQTPDHYVRELQRAGYATDPQYANKILNIAERHFSERHVDGDDASARGDQG